MSTKKATKRALLTSILAICLCLVMLIGSTFAWFTDTASTSVNQIQSGTLDVDIVDEAGNSLTGTGENAKKLNFVNTENETAILWEPGVTFNTTVFKIKNAGNLALKWKVEIIKDNLTNGTVDPEVTSNVSLLEVIKFSVVNAETEEIVPIETFEDHLSKETTSGKYYLQGHMDEMAGNAYQGLTLDGVGIKVYATQYTEEYDSNDNQYDKGAEYAIPVGTVDELNAAVKAGENVVLTSDLSMPSALNITKDISIDLNGKTVMSDQSFAQVLDGTLTLTGGTVESGNVAVRVEENGKAIINGGTYSGIYTVYATNGGTATINGGEFISQEFTCAVPNGGNVTINGGTFTAKDNAVVGTNGSSNYASSTIIINGGTFNGNITSAGYIACGVYVANNDTVTINGGTFNITDGVGILMRAGNTTIGENVVINLTNTGKITQGKVGDATIDITTPSYLVQDVRSGYPGATAGFTITNNSAYALVDYK